MENKEYQIPEAKLAKNAKPFDKMVNHLYEKGKLNHIFSDGDDMGDNRQLEMMSRSPEEELELLKYKKEAERAAKAREREAAFAEKQEMEEKERRIAAVLKEQEEQEKRERKQNEETLKRILGQPEQDLLPQNWDGSEPEL